MVTKTSANRRPYEVDGKALLWHPEDDDGERGNLPDVRIPFRLKLKVVLALSEVELDTTGMRTFLAAVIPGQMETVEEMDINDFQDMFLTWQSEYNSLTGGSLGEPSLPAESSPSTEAPSSTTSAVSGSPSPTSAAVAAGASAGEKQPVS